MEILLFLGTGLVAGVASGFFGIGGGLVVVPLCMLLGEGVKSAIALSTMQMVFSSIYGSFINAKDRLFEPIEYVPLGIGGILGASCGAYLLSIVSAHAAALLFFSILVLTFFKTIASKAEGEIGAKTPPRWILFIFGFCTASYAGLVGVGGGFIIVVFLNGFFGIHIKSAVSISLFFVLFVGSSAFATYSFMGFIDYYKGGALAIGALLGVRFGIGLARKTTPIFHKRAIIFAYLLMMALTAYKIARGEI
ncbi:UPF0721 transmembrane protein [Campylobacterota bacterium]|nr:UPF0721 transmembrane protein [Campylobacterota bacterium]